MIQFYLVLIYFQSTLYFSLNKKLQIYILEKHEFKKERKKESIHQGCQRRLYLFIYYYLF